MTTTLPAQIDGHIYHSVPTPSMDWLLCDAASLIACEQPDHLSIVDGAMDLLINYHWTHSDGRIVFTPGTPVDGELSRMANAIYARAFGLPGSKIQSGATA